MWTIDKNHYKGCQKKKNTNISGKNTKKNRVFDIVQIIAVPAKSSE